MARPPRVPVMLPWECRVIYFITICIRPRCNALANDAAWNVVCKTLDRLNKWNTYCIITMPDHIHLLTAPLDRELRVAAFLKWFKRWFNESYGACEKWQWQPEVLIVFYERRSQFMKSGITFERIQFELIWSLTGSSGLIKKDLATTGRLSIGVSQNGVGRAERHRRAGRRPSERGASESNALQNYSNSAICTAFKAAPFNN
jgi:REP element-mobilizing transposase RayT